MPTVNIKPIGSPSEPPRCVPLPQLIRTPSGLALIEIQGTINTTNHAGSLKSDAAKPPSINLGRLAFPEGISTNEARGPKVTLFIGKHQKLAGEIRKLPKPLAIIRKSQEQSMELNGKTNNGSELKIIEVVKYKIVFSQRPEPISQET